MPAHRIATIVLLAALAVGMPGSGLAWDRGKVDILTVLPAGSTGPEGLTVGPDGNIYVTTFGFNSQGSVSGPSPHVLGLEFNPKPTDLIVLDFGAGTARKVGPQTGHSSLFMTASTTGVPDPKTPGTDPLKSGLNALTFDRKGNAYISDSFQGIVWTVGPNGGATVNKLGTIWVEDATLTTSGFPPFGVNGVEFNNAGNILFAANTGNRQLIQLPVNPHGTAGTPSVFVNSLGGADGVRIDADDNIWVCANQEDEIVVVDPTGKVIAKLGDFYGVDEK